MKIKEKLKKKNQSSDAAVSLRYLSHKSTNFSNEKKKNLNKK